MLYHITVPSSKLVHSALNKDFTFKVMFKFMTETHNNLKESVSGTVWPSIRHVTQVIWSQVMSQVKSSQVESWVKVTMKNFQFLLIIAPPLVKSDTTPTPVVKIFASDLFWKPVTKMTETQWQTVLRPRHRCCGPILQIGPLQHPVFPHRRRDATPGPN